MGSTELKTRFVCVVTMVLVALSEVGSVPCHDRPWIVEKNVSCTCGQTRGSVVMCDDSSVRLRASYCMTYSNDTGVVGHCLAGSTPAGSGVQYQRIPNNISELQYVMCTRYNREGQMCGRCMDGFAVPVYSYQWTCVKCSDSNWLRYIIVAYFPLTLFFVLLLIFRINVSSAPFNAFILVSHIISAEPQMRYIANFSDQIHGYWKYFGYYGSLTAYGIWSLDFFRLVWKPFCLYPGMSMLEVMALEYLIAFYPLVLITLLYFLVKLHHYNFRIVVCLCKPIHWLMGRFRRQFNVQTSLMDMFVTFFYLSYMKFITISFGIIVPNFLFDVHGKTLARPFLFYDGTVEYLGSTHRPYAFLALAVLLVFVVSPLLVILLYQCRCTHRKAVSRALMGTYIHLFMDAVQGGYKDGTNGSRDCRCFVLVYLVLRLLLLLTCTATLDVNVYILGGINMVIAIVLTAVISPYKVKCHNYLDVVLLGSAALMYLLVASLGHASADDSFLLRFLEALFFISAQVPLVYMCGYILYRMVRQMSLAQLSALLKLFFWKSNGSRARELEGSLPHRITHAREYTPLLMEASVETGK